MASSLPGLLSPQPIQAEIFLAHMSGGEANVLNNFLNISGDSNQLFFQQQQKLNPVGGPQKIFLPPNVSFKPHAKFQTLQYLFLGE